MGISTLCQDASGSIVYECHPVGLIQGNGQVFERPKITLAIIHLWSVCSSFGYLFCQFFEMHVNIVVVLFLLIVSRGQKVRGQWEEARQSFLMGVAAWVLPHLRLLKYLLKRRWVAWQLFSP